MPRTGRAPDAPPPAFQFYPADFLSDEHVDGMTLEERGAHITLMCHAWKSGSIPAEPERIARLLHIDGSAMDRLWPAVSRAYSQGEDGRLIQPRLERERIVQMGYRAEQAEKGRKGAAARWHGHSPATDRPLANDSSSSSRGDEPLGLSSSPSARVETDAALGITETPAAPPPVPQGGGGARLPCGHPAETITWETTETLTACDPHGTALEIVQRALCGECREPIGQTRTSPGRCLQCAVADACK